MDFFSLDYLIPKVVFCQGNGKAPREFIKPTSRPKARTPLHVHTFSTSVLLFFNNPIVERVAWLSSFHLSFTARRKMEVEEVLLGLGVAVTFAFWLWPSLCIWGGALLSAQGNTQEAAFWGARGQRDPRGSGRDAICLFPPPPTKPDFTRLLIPLFFSASSTSSEHRQLIFFGVKSTSNDGHDGYSGDDEIPARHIITIRFDFWQEDLHVLFGGLFGDFFKFSC